MCIYYKNRSGLHYNSKEHIFPAGIGGVFSLASGIVSDEFNNGISKLEQSFLRDSFVGIGRQIEVPGKRGSLDPQKATKSKVHLIVDTADSSAFSIGYVMLHRTHEIPQALVDTSTGHLSFSFNKSGNSDHTKVLSEFAATCGNFQDLKIRIIKDDRLPKTLVLFGIAENVEENFNAFFVIHSQSKAKPTAELINTFGKSVANSKNEPASKTYLPQSHLQAKFDIEHFRVHAKIAFNALAFLKDQHFVLADRFDPVRNWIANGGYNSFAYVNNQPSLFLDDEGKSPRNIHYVLFTALNRSLMAQVCFYGTLKTDIILCDNFSEGMLDGIICDWTIHRDLTFVDFMKELDSKAKSVGDV